jgi:hypothetical protein
MSTVVTNARKNRKSFWATIVAGGALSTLVGLATVESVLFTAIRADARVAATQTLPTATLDVDVAPGTLGIVPSPVIDPNPVFFFGAGDGSAGFYAEQPTSKSVTTALNAAPNSD